VDICHDQFPIVPFHISLPVGTISKESYNIFVLYLHQAFNLSVEFRFNHESVGQSLHSDSPIAKYSLSLADVSIALSFEIKRD
jgi:hypothetical protein